MKSPKTLNRTQTGKLSAELHSVILHVSDGPRAIKIDIPTSAAHGGTDYKELEIETVTKMEKLSRRLLFNVDSLPIKSFKMTYLNDAQPRTRGVRFSIVQVEGKGGAGKVCLPHKLGIGGWIRFPALPASVRLSHTEKLVSIIEAAPQVWRRRHGLKIVSMP